MNGSKASNPEGMSRTSPAILETPEHPEPFFPLTPACAEASPFAPTELRRDKSAGRPTLSLRELNMSHNFPAGHRR
jgi:hypothetical protein